MVIGKKTGERHVGMPKKRTVALTARLEALGCDPIEGMAQLAMNEANPPQLLGRMYAELAGYLFPKRKANEIKIGDGTKVTFQFISEPEWVSKVDTNIECLGVD